MSFFTPLKTLKSFFFLGFTVKGNKRPTFDKFPGMKILYFTYLRQ